MSDALLVFVFYGSGARETEIFFESQIHQSFGQLATMDPKLSRGEGLAIIDAENVLFGNGPVSAVADVWNVRLKKQVVSKLPSHTVFPNFIHHSALCERADELEPIGLIIHPRVVVSHSVEFSSFVKVGVGCSIGHDVNIGSFVNIAPNATIMGNAIIGSNVEIGGGAVILPGVHVADGCRIGAGCVIAGDTEANGLYSQPFGRKMGEVQ